MFDNECAILVFNFIINGSDIVAIVVSAYGVWNIDFSTYLVSDSKC